MFGARSEAFSTRSSLASSTWNCLQHFVPDSKLSLPRHPSGFVLQGGRSAYWEVCTTTSVRRVRRSARDGRYAHGISRVSPPTAPTERKQKAISKSSVFSSPPLWRSAFLVSSCCLNCLCCVKREGVGCSRWISPHFRRRANRRSPIPVCRAPTFQTERASSTYLSCFAEALRARQFREKWTSQTSMRYREQPRRIMSPYSRGFWP